MQCGAHDLAQHIELEESFPIYLQQSIPRGDDVDLPFFRLALDLHSVTHKRPGDCVRRIILVHFVIRDLKHKEMLLT